MRFMPRSSVSSFPFNPLYSFKRRLSSRVCSKLASTLALALAFCSTCFAADSSNKNQPEPGFVSLFDGKTLDGWTPNEKPESFVAEDGCIHCLSGFAHLFYTGTVNNHNFTNFELRAEFKMSPVANSGFFSPAANEGGGKVSKGYEAQICSKTHADPRKTGSLYAIQDIHENVANDDEWNSYTIIIQGKRITLKVNDKVTVDYTEPENPKRAKGRERRVLSSGTFALQGHEAGSHTWFRNIRVKVLPS